MKTTRPTDSAAILGAPSADHETKRAALARPPVSLIRFLPTLQAKR
jgi:hypothetical protein